MQEIQIGLVLFVSCLAFFLLGYQWAISNQKSYYDSLGSEDDEQKLEQQLNEYKQKEEQYIKQIQDLKKQLGMKTNSKNTDI
ncbi:unnamed protein product [Paramecium primaurelia]|uniref:Uncharacterized protein n=2 Tax=Paramecium TaxID=5884 RepID=A0A8S1S746_9CILI|nr:unnamed protein product [Paramecium primaurelia]CAD8135553.1 unnamed protein product [Paramecium pentaurelia]